MATSHNNLFMNKDAFDASFSPSDHGCPSALTVTELGQMIKGIVADAIPSKIQVVGEISNFSNRTHWFFSLKDQGGSVRCVCFASVAKRVRFPVQNGLAVVATGRLDYYEAQGQLQFYIDKLEPVGQGALEMQLRAMIEQLRQEGYFEPSHKLAMPAIVERLAVVTSRNAAALADVIDTARRRWPGCQLFLFDVRVQGASAAGEIAHALKQLSRDGEALGIDAIILTRGGGAIEDLWAFNERVVAEAVYQCRLPIVAAIGHETDTTVAELVADMRCATPTQAAMALVPDREALAHQVTQTGRRLSLLMQRQYEAECHRFKSLAQRPFFKRPIQMIQPINDRVQRLQKRLQTAVLRKIDKSRWQQKRLEEHPFFKFPTRMTAPLKNKLSEVSRRLEAALTQRLSQDAQRLKALNRQLQAVAPNHVLQRGYSYTLDAKGKLLRHVEDINAGEQLTTVLIDGSIQSIVQPNDYQNKPKVATGKIGGEPCGESVDELGGKVVGKLGGKRRATKKQHDAGPGLFD